MLVGMFALESFSMSLIQSMDENTCMLCSCVDRIPDRRVLRGRRAKRYLVLVCGHVYCGECIGSMVKVRMRRCSFCRRQITMKLFRLAKGI